MAAAAQGPDDQEAAVVVAGAKAPWWARTWAWFSTPLAVVGLASLTDDLVRWAKGINWLVQQYQSVTGAAFAWIAPYLPFRIPQE